MLMMRYAIFAIPAGFVSFSFSHFLFGLAQQVIGVEVPGWANFGLAGLVVAAVIMWKRQDDIRYQIALKELAEKQMSVDERHSDTMQSLSEKQIAVNVRTADAMTDVAAAVAKLADLDEIKGLLREAKD